MTIEEFDNTKFRGSMSLTYEDKTYDLASVNFKEKLIAFSTEFDDDLTWVRCENVKIN